MVNLIKLCTFITRDWKKTLKFILTSLLIIIIPIIGPLLLTGLMIITISETLKTGELPEIFKNLKKLLIHSIIFSLFTYGILIIIILISVAPIIPNLLNKVPNSISELKNLSIIPFLILPGLILLFILFWPIITLNYADKETLKSLFEFKHFLNMISNNTGNYLNMLLITLLLLTIINTIPTLIHTYIPLLTIGLNLLIISKIWTDWYKKANI